jgi:hypothetical protein
MVLTKKKKKRDSWYGAKHAKKAWRKIKEDFTFPVFDVLLALLIGFAVWADRYQHNHKIKRAAQTGVLAFIIAYLGRLDLVFIAAILVFGVIMFSSSRPGE